MRQSFYDFCCENKRLDLLVQWDTEANLPLTPKDISYGSSRSCHWICARGHRWTTKAFLRTTNGSGCPVCAGKKIVPGVNDLATLYPDLAAEWDGAKNAPLKPDALSPNAHNKVWWRCSVCGHEWRSTVKSRGGTLKTGCPACAGRVVLPDVNDLKTLYPQIAMEWHPTKNGALTPRDVTCGTARRVWWRCKMGHEWRASVARRTSGCGCPVCAGKSVLIGENDLKTSYPAIAAQWHPTKNGALTPEAVTPSSNRGVWWQCEKGHEYKASIASRTAHGSGCPYCANRRVLAGYNDLATKEPQLAKQWHPTLNEALTPRDVTCGSTHKVWWRCDVCGFEWKALIYSRAGVQKTGCPACAGRVKERELLRYDRVLSESR